MLRHKVAHLRCRKLARHRSPIKVANVSSETILQPGRKVVATFVELGHVPETTSSVRVPSPQNREWQVLYDIHSRSFLQRNEYQALLQEQALPHPVPRPVYPTPTKILARGEPAPTRKPAASLVKAALGSSE